MKKFQWKIILNASFLIVATLAAGFILGFQTLKPIKNVSAEDKDPASINIEFKAGEVTRTANRFENDTFQYNPEEELYFAGTPNVSLNQKQNYMLRNLTAQNLLLQGSGIQQVKNIYIGFGTPYDTVMNINSETGEKYGDHGLLLSYLAVTAKLNGQNFSINNTVSDTRTALEGTNITDFKYWYDYIDLKNIKDQLSGLPITETEGHYSFTFTYSYLIKNGNVYSSVGPFNHTFEFYLIDETTYSHDYTYNEQTYHNYPSINNSVLGNKEVSSSIEQFFYNFQTESLPTLTYDASLYNITITKNKDNETENITTLFSKNPDGSGKLIVTSNKTGAKEVTLSNNNGRYIQQFTFEELGTYTILVRYVIETQNGYHIISNSEIPAYNITRIDEKGNNPYLLEDGLAMSYYKLHVFGIKGYFTKNKLNTHLKNNGIAGDYTAKINAVNPITDTSKGQYLLVNDDKYPETNLPPISFTSYGIYAYNENDSTIPLSKVYRYKNEFNVSSDNSPTESYLTKNSLISGAGYYEVVIAYT